MAETRYICAGSCGGEFTEEEYKAGQTTCNDETCDQYGEPLEKMLYCPACDEFFVREEEHATCE